MSKKINIAAGFSLLVFALTAILTVSGNLDTLNNSLSEVVHSLETPALTVILKIITNISEWFVYVPITLLLFALSKLRWKVGFPATVTLMAAGALNWILKQLFAIPRPDVHQLIAESGFGFPSGHAMNGATFIGICVLLFVRYTSNKPRKITVSILAALFMLAVGFSRVYLGVHNPTDIVAGYAMGLLLSLLTLCVMGVVQKRKSSTIRISGQ